MIRLCPVTDIDRVWPLLLDGMVEACRRFGDDISAWHLLQWCRRSDALLFCWFADEDIKAGIVVRPEQWGKEQVLRVLALTGHDMDEWAPHLGTCKEWQKFVGDMPIIFEGRPGWQRVLPGVRVLRTVYRWEPDNGR